MSISDFFQKLVETSNSKLSDIVEGDIIWARRYKNEKEKQAIPDGHREGPFIVLSNNGKELEGDLSRQSTLRLAFQILRTFFYA